MKSGSCSKIFSRLTAATCFTMTASCLLAAASTHAAVCRAPCCLSNTRTFKPSNARWTVRKCCLPAAVLEGGAPPFREPGGSPPPAPSADPSRPGRPPAPPWPPPAAVPGRWVLYQMQVNTCCLHASIVVNIDVHTSVHQYISTSVQSSVLGNRRHDKYMHKILLTCIHHDAYMHTYMQEK